MAISTIKQFIPARHSPKESDKLSVDCIKYTANYIIVSFNSRARGQMNPIFEWTKLHESGKCVNPWAVAFKTEEQLSMFRLTWATDIDWDHATVEGKR